MVLHLDSFVLSRGDCSRVKLSPRQTEFKGGYYLSIRPVRICTVNDVTNWWRDSRVLLAVYLSSNSLAFSTNWFVGLKEGIVGACRIGLSADVPCHFCLTDRTARD